MLLCGPRLVLVGLHVLKEHGEGRVIITRTNFTQNSDRERYKQKRVKLTHILYAQEVVAHLIYLVSYFIKWVTASWTDGSNTQKETLTREEGRKRKRKTAPLQRRQFFLLILY